MNRTSHSSYSIDPNLLLNAYAQGLFPMAEHAEADEIFWLRPEKRGIIPLDPSLKNITQFSDKKFKGKTRKLGESAPSNETKTALNCFHIPKSLAKFARKKPFDIRFDTDFAAVIDACAAPREGREKTWISAPIHAAYLELFKLGHGHSVEAWHEERLVGGLYGVKLQGAFFGESMFSRATNASKLCLVALVEHLQARGFKLLDIQFLTSHLAQFGAIEISRRHYECLLIEALALDAEF